MKKLCLFFLVNSFIITINAQEVLENIEANIVEAYSKSFETQKDLLLPLIKKLEISLETTKEEKIRYWIAFSIHKQASYYSIVKSKDNLPLELLEKGIKHLKEKASQTSEDLALQATMLSFSIAFRPQIAAIISSEANLLYKKAIELDNNNLRAYLGMGKSDFHRPQKYGGGNLVEQYLKLALTKSDKINTDRNSPSWGRNEVYYYLASYYDRENRSIEAKLYCNQGLNLFPDDFRLNRLLKKLNG